MMFIDAKGLSKVYTTGETKTYALRDATVKIDSGEFVSIIGPSGSGKSTLMQILGFLDRPTSGTYFFEEEDVETFDDAELAKIRNEKVGFIFQSFNLLPRLTALENVAIPLLYAGVKEPKRTQRAEAVLTKVGLSDRMSYETLKLSGGQKQRVAIARALVNNPSIIFADEPTGNLDSASGQIVLDELNVLHKQGNTIVVVTHDMNVAKAADRLIHIKDGVIEKDEVVRTRS